MGATASVSDAIDALSRRFGDRLGTGRSLCAQHANTASWLAAQPPDAVVWPLSTEDVVAIVGIARTHRVPLIPFGAGTSLEGHVNAPHGGISVDFSRMTRIRAVEPRDLDCTVEPGVTRPMLNQHVRDLGLFFSVDPGAADATLGGMAATRASGTNAMRYGTMRDNVLSLEAVLANGEIIRTGGRARKSAAGFDLTHLLVGSEGTLGLITELTLKLHPIPQTILAVVCPFATIEGACAAVIGANERGLGLARVELLDALQIRAINAYSKLDLSEAPYLFVEIAGGEAATAEQLAAFREVAQAHGALRFDWAKDEPERAKLWRARHDAYWAVKAMWPGRTMSASDVCVPVSRLADCVTATIADFEAAGVTAPVVGHVGDGNFHVIPVVDAGDAKALSQARAALDRLVERALQMGGTCTGEHGVGQGKQAYLVREFGVGAVQAMAAIKASLDPLGILNPGKITTGAGLPTVEQY